MPQFVSFPPEFMLAPKRPRTHSNASGPCRAEGAPGRRRPLVALFAARLITPRCAIGVALAAIALVGTPLRLVRGQADSAHRRPPVEELFKSSLAFTQERGETQVATGFATSRRGSGSAMAIPTDIEFGVTDATQLEFHGTAAQRAPSNGWSTPLSRGASIGLTTVRHDWERGLHVGLSVEAQLQWKTVVDEAQESQRVHVETPSLLVGWDVNHSVPAHLFAKLAGAGARCANDNEGESDEPACTVGAVLSAGERLRITLELPVNSRGAALASLTPGMIWRVSGFEVGAAISATRDRRSPLAGTRLLLVREF